tara:strand:+ start:878 stop:1021 length:144 start_codon:yes stop_codon:yes gene_type:complete
MDNNMSMYIHAACMYIYMYMYMHMYMYMSFAPGEYMYIHDLAVLLRS